MINRDEEKMWINVLKIFWVGKLAGMEVGVLNVARKAAVSYDNRRNRLKVRQKSEEVKKVKGNLQKTFEHFFDGKLAGMDKAAFNLARKVVVSYNIRRTRLHLRF